MTTWALLAPGPSATADQAARAHEAGIPLGVVGCAFQLAPWAEFICASDRGWWRKSAAAFMDTKSQLGNVHAGAIISCADELEAALTREAPTEALDYRRDALDYGFSLNDAAWVFVEQCPEKSALLFNNTKAPLRAAILKYLDSVDERQAPATPPAPQRMAQGEDLTQFRDAVTHYRAYYASALKLADGTDRLFARRVSEADRLLALINAAPQVEAKRQTGEGFVLVPRDLRTACDVWEAGIRARNNNGSVADIWAAMIAAAAAAKPSGEE